jgi:hypothetical protein
MIRVCLSALFAIALAAGTLKGAGTLDIYFIDVEGGQSTLMVTPAGETVLIDAGYGARNGRDPDRVMATIHAAGVDHIDYFWRRTSIPIMWEAFPSWRRAFRSTRSSTTARRWEPTAWRPARFAARGIAPARSAPHAAARRSPSVQGRRG